MNSEAIAGKCWQCGADLYQADYGRETDCRACGKPTRVCRNCLWYAPDQPNQCEEPMANRVMEKERANFCGYFDAISDIKSVQQGTSAEELRQAAADLFKH